MASAGVFIFLLPALWIAVVTGVRLREDPIAAAANPLIPCSCSCCVTRARAPMEMIGGENAEAMPFMCGHVTIEGTCPAQCGNNKQQSVIMSAQTDAVEASRFCTTSCLPPSEQNQKCLPIPSKLIDDAMDEDGNADGDAQRIHAKELAEAMNSGQQETNDGDAKESDAEKLADDLEEKEEKAKVETVVKMRNVDLNDEIAKRKNAEGEAVVEEATAADARAKFALVKAQDAFSDVEREKAGLEESVREAEALEIKAQDEAAAAEKDEEVGRANLAEVKQILMTVAQKTAEAAEKQVKKEIAKPAKEWAEYKAELYGWNKPDFWPKVMAAKAADPFNNQAVIATARVAEYTAAAKAARGKADGNDAKVKLIAKHLAVSRALHDDKLFRDQRNEIKALNAESASFRSQADGFMTTAATAQNLISQYQDAAMTAVVRSQYEFANTYTPPPTTA